MRHYLVISVHLCRKLFVAVIVTSVFGIGVYHTTLTSWQQEKAANTPSLHPPQSAPFLTASTPSPGYHTSERNHSSNNTEPTVLVVYDSVNRRLAEQVRTFLEAHRVRFVLHGHDRSSTARLPWVVPGNGTARGLYGLLVFADVSSFISRWSEGERRTYTDYCKRFGVSAVFLTDSSGPLKRRVRSGKHTFGHRISSPDSVNVTSSIVFNHTKPGIVVGHVPKGVAWLTFTPPPPGSSGFLSTQVWASATYHKTVRPVVFLAKDEAMVSAYFGMPFDFWLTKLMFLDALSLLPDPLVPALRYGGERQVMVDVDDIFVAEENMRLHREDVEVRVW